MLNRLFSGPDWGIVHAASGPGPAAGPTVLPFGAAVYLRAGTGCRDPTRPLRCRRLRPGRDRLPGPNPPPSVPPFTSGPGPAAGRGGPSGQPAEPHRRDREPLRAADQPVDGHVLVDRVGDRGAVGVEAGRA